MGEKPSRPIKVMHIIARMNVGGPAVEITELMRGLDPNVISQRLVTGYCNEEEADFLETQAPDISATRIDGLGRTIRPADDAKALATLIRIIRASRPDIVHTHTAKAGVLGRIAAKTAATGAKIIHTYHGHLLHGYFGPEKTRALILLERKLSKITNRIVTVGDRVRDDLLAAGIGAANQYNVIRSGITLGPLPEKQTARRELGLEGNQVIVSMIGRLTSIKRPDRFLDVASLAARRSVDAHFLIAGGGECEPEIRRRVLEEDLPVAVLGWRNDIPRLLAATDILLVTSDNEGLPLSLIQAALARVPCVATNVGSIREFITSGSSGVLCSPEPQTLVKALEALVYDPIGRSVMGQKAYSEAVSNFSTLTFLREHAELYASQHVPMIRAYSKH